MQRATVKLKHYHFCLEFGGIHLFCSYFLSLSLSLSILFNSNRFIGLTKIHFVLPLEYSEKVHYFCNLFQKVKLFIACKVKHFKSVSFSFWWFRAYSSKIQYLKILEYFRRSIKKRICKFFEVQAHLNKFECLGKVHLFASLTSYTIHTQRITDESHAIVNVISRGLSVNYGSVY